MTGRLSPDQFAQQFRESFRMLWWVACGIVNDAALAEDVVQEAAVVALGKLDQFEPGSNFGAWMGRVVRFVALNQVRKKQRRHAASLDEPGVGEDAALATRAAARPLRLTSRGGLPEDQAHFDDSVMAVLGELHETARACLLLRTVEGMAYAEMAQLLEIPEGTAMSHVHRARRLLRDRLAQRAPGGVAGTAGTGRTGKTAGRGERGGRHE